MPAADRAGVRRAALRSRVRSALALLTSAERREQRRRARFWELAARYSPLLAVDDLRGNRMLVSSADRDVGRELFIYRAYDPAALACAASILARRGFVPEQIIDVGANIGTAVIDLVSRYPSASAVALEPEPAAFALLEHNLAANGLARRVRAHRCAAAAADGTLELELATGNAGDHRVRVAATPGAFDEQHRSTIEVPALRVDALVERGELDPTHPTLLWIDVQGYEAQVLDGARLLRDAAVVVELWPYGLRRTGGLERLLKIVSGFEQIYEIRERERPLGHAELPALVAELDRRQTPFTDLLLLPRAVP